MTLRAAVSVEVSQVIEYPSWFAELFGSVVGKSVFVALVQVAVADKIVSPTPQ
jgi:hypothetical protein